MPNFTAKLASAWAKLGLRGEFKATQNAVDLMQASIIATQADITANAKLAADLEGAPKVTRRHVQIATRFVLG
jgi:hypothetical protein